jgi:hypothetical protein
MLVRVSVNGNYQCAARMSGTEFHKRGVYFLQLGDGGTEDHQVCHARPQHCAFLLEIHILSSLHPQERKFVLDGLDIEGFCHIDLFGK